MTFDNFGDGAAGRTFCVAEIVVRLVRLVMSAVVSLVLTQSVSFDFFWIAVSGFILKCCYDDVWLLTYVCLVWHGPLYRDNANGIK